MARPKKGTKGAEEATRKWRGTMQRKYGGAVGVHNMMRIIGSKGGKAPTNKPKGFAANPELAKRAGAKGGRTSRRTGIKNGEGKTSTKDIDEMERILEEESGRDKRVTY